jgi:hypothetical protein
MRMSTVSFGARRAGRGALAFLRHGACALAAAAAASSPALALTSVLSVDFESYRLGPLGAPWSIVANPGSASTARIVSTPDHGKALLLHGSKAADFLITSLKLASSASQIGVDVNINPETGAAFVWSFHGAGPSIGSRRIRLQREPGSTTLVASTSPSGNTSCGTLPSNGWSRVTLLVHGDALPHTFDVRINGSATACRGVVTRLSPPFSQVSVMDASNAGWGGKVLFDNISVTTP